MQNGNDDAKSDGKLKLGVHMSYGVSQFGLNAIGTAFGVNALFFYTTEFGFSTALFGAIMLIGKLWDAVSDPMMGYLSDTTSWRRGRRRPFLPIGYVSLGIAFLLVFSPPDLGGSQAALFAYLLVLTVLMFTGRTVFETPYLALAPEMTQDYNERTRLSGYKQFMGTLGDAIGAMLPLVMLEIWFVGQRRTAHFVYGVFACVIMIVFGEITRRGTFENPNLAAKTPVGTIESFKAVAKNKPYLIFIFSSTAAQMGNNIVTFLVLFMTKYWFLDESLALWFFGAFFTGAAASAPLWVFVSNRLGKKPAYIIALIGYGLLLSSIMLIARDAISTIKIAMFFAGFFNVGLWVLAGTIQPDIIEWDQYHTGKRREGVYAGVWTFVNKTGIGLTLAILGLALDMIGLDTGLAIQSDETLLGLRFLFGPAAAVLLFAAAAAFFAYPITRSKYEEIRRLIAIRQEKDA